VEIGSGDGEGKRITCAHIEDTYFLDDRMVVRNRREGAALNVTRFPWDVGRRKGHLSGTPPMSSLSTALAFHGDTSPRVVTVACPVSSFDSVSTGKSNGHRVVGPSPAVSGVAPTIWVKTSTTYDTG